MTAPRTPPPNAEPGESFARVLCRAIGIVVAYWDVIGLPKAHPYRQAAAMVTAYLKRSA